MYEIQVIDTLDKLTAIKDEWNLLWGKHETNNPYQRWEWNHTWAKCFGSGTGIFVLAMRRENGELACITPLQLNNICGIVKQASFISQTASIYPDLIISNGEEASITKSLANYLHRNTAIGAVNLIISEPTTTLRYLKHAFEDLGWYGVVTIDYTKRLVVNMGTSYEKYLESLSSKMRQEIRAETKKIEKRHAVRFLATDTDSDLENAMKTLFYLHSLRWEGDPEKIHPERRECYRALHHGNGARIFTLHCGDKPVGALSALLTSDTLFAEIAGFDFSIGKFDLGKVFYHHLFLWAEKNGYTKIDFSSGEEPYKFRYNPQILSKWNLIAYRNRTASKLIAASRSFADTSKNFKKGIMNNRIYRASGIHNLYLKLREKSR